MSAILDSLRWRYAVKAYDPTQKLSREDVEYLKEATRLAPSSFGLQPYRVLLVTDPATRVELRAASFGQPQITDGAALLVFAIEDVIDETYVRRIFAGQSPARINATLAAIARKSPSELREWAARQAYLALGFLLVAAAERRIDANPMEGFLPHRYDQILGLRAQGLSSVVIAAIGHRSPEDRFQHFPKHRRSEEELFPELGVGR